MEVKYQDCLSYNCLRRCLCQSCLCPTACAKAFLTTACAPAALLITGATAALMTRLRSSCPNCLGPGCLAWHGDSLQRTSLLWKALMRLSRPCCMGTAQSGTLMTRVEGESDPAQQSSRSGAHLSVSSMQEGRQALNPLST